MSKPVARGWGLRGGGWSEQRGAGLRGAQSGRENTLTVAGPEPDYRGKALALHMPDLGLIPGPGCGPLSPLRRDQLNAEPRALLAVT